MEIPEISMISDFQAGMNCLKNPSLVSRFIPLSGIEKVPQVYSFWKWGAVILAILATFSSVIKRVKLLIIHIRRIKPSPELILQHLDLDLDLSDDDDDIADVDDNQNSVDSSDYDEEDEPITSFWYKSSAGDEDFSVKGSGNFFRNQWQNANLNLRRRILGERSGLELNWADFPAGKNVVKLWDSLGLSLGFDPFEDSDSESVVSLWDFNKEQKINDIFVGGANFPAISVAAAPSSRTVVLSAKKNEKTNGGVILGAYDTRMKGHVPASYADWSQQHHSTSPANVISGISGVDDKVYLRDDDGKGVVTVGDLRKFKKPLETLTEANCDNWCDADAAIVDGSIQTS